MSWIDEIAQGINQGTGIVTNLIGSGLNWATTQYTNAQNRREAQKNRQWQEAMMDKQNAYNDPSAQIERLKKAGINPYLQGSQVNSTPSATAGSGAQATYTPPTMQNIGESIAQQSSLEMQTVDILSKEEDVRRQRLENGILENTLSDKIKGEKGRNTSDWVKGIVDGETIPEKISGEIGRNQSDASKGLVDSNADVIRADVELRQYDAEIKSADAAIAEWKRENSVFIADREFQKLDAEVKKLGKDIELADLDKALKQANIDMTKEQYDQLKKIWPSVLKKAKAEAEIARVTADKQGEYMDSQIGSNNRSGSEFSQWRDAVLGFFGFDSMKQLGEYFGFGANDKSDYNADMPSVSDFVLHVMPNVPLAKWTDKHWVREFAKNWEKRRRNGK